MKTFSLVSLALLLAFGGSARAAEPERPNILWLVSEDNDAFLGCYGDPLAHTPTIDRLAHEGVLYERCFAWPVIGTNRTDSTDFLSIVPSVRLTSRYKSCAPRCGPTGMHIRPPGLS